MELKSVENGTAELLSTVQAVEAGPAELHENELNDLTCPTCEIVARLAHCHYSEKNGGWHQGARREHGNVVKIKQSPLV